MVPVIYKFGDSLADVGNNNYLKISLAKANFPHNGVDFPNKKATGRFGNGKNAADFLVKLNNSITYTITRGYRLSMHVVTMRGRESWVINITTLSLTCIQVQQAKTVLPRRS
ncbi:hypothetical protein CerSpe_158810 [Prunus speciosa]